MSEKVEKKSAKSTQKAPKKPLGILKYFRDLISEAKKISWPSPKQVFGRQSRPWDCLGVRARSSRELLIQSYRKFFLFF